MVYVGMRGLVVKRKMTSFRGCRVLIFKFLAESFELFLCARVCVRGLLQSMHRNKTILIYFKSHT